MRTMRRLALLCGALLTLVLFTGTAQAQDNYPPTVAGVSINPNPLAPCSTGAVTGTGFPGNTGGTVTVGGTVYNVTTGADGSFSLTITVPCGTAAQVLGVSVTIGGVSSGASLTVSGGSSNGGAIPSGNLPYTGSNTDLLLRVGALLLLGGGALVLVSVVRRRNAAPVA